jgi:hypothetical protein
METLKGVVWQMGHANSKVPALLVLLLPPIGA